MCEETGGKLAGPQKARPEIRYQRLGAQETDMGTWREGMRLSERLCDDICAKYCIIRMYSACEGLVVVRT